MPTINIRNTIPMYRYIWKEENKKKKIQSTLSTQLVKILRDPTAKPISHRHNEREKLSSREPIARLLAL